VLSLALQKYALIKAEITNPRSTHYPELLDSLFAVQPVASARQADDKLLDFTYDNDNDDELQVWLSVVVQRLVDLFQRHGAVDDFVPLLMRETNLLAVFPDLNPVRLMDRAGQIVQLPCSGMLALARSAARRQIERIKRYTTGRARYSEHPAGGQPKVIGELRFVLRWC
jgi:translation initiation factor 2-alpha kinase 4